VALAFFTVKLPYGALAPSTYNPITFLMVWSERRELLEPKRLSNNSKSVKKEEQIEL
jgi:hypothetical protein